MKINKILIGAILLTTLTSCFDLKINLYIGEEIKVHNGNFIDLLIEKTNKKFNYSFSNNFKANKIKISYNQKILVEMDGEVHLLEPDFYPLYMERTEPIIPIIECNNQEEDKGGAPYIK